MGFKKGMVSAARDLNIPTVEIQHGYVGRGHLAYWYPHLEQSLKLGTITDYFFTFSDYWSNNISYPTRKRISIGNDFYHIEKSFSKQKNKLMVTSVMRMFMI